MTTSMLDFTNVTNITNAEKHLCFKALYWTLPNSNVRLWDLLILIPNVLFICYLLSKTSTALALIKRFNRQIFMVLFFLVFVSHVLSIIRCIVNMSVHSSTYDVIDRVMWLILKFFLLATELSVVTFGLLFGHLDSRTSIKRVLIVTFTLSLIYSTTQGVLEFLNPNDTFHDIHDGMFDYTLFGHGGIIFWFCSSFLLFFMYTLICFMPFIPLKGKIIIPAKKSFYVYCLILSLLNLLQGIGSVLLFKDVVAGMCIVDLTTLLYFSSFSPLVYLIFLYPFFSAKRSTTLMFSYRTHTEDYDEDDDDDELYVPPPQTTIDFISDMDQQLLDAVDSGTFSTAVAPTSGSSAGFNDPHFLNYNNEPSYGNNLSPFSYNPFCPTLTNHPDISIATPSILSTYGKQSDHLQSNNNVINNRLSLKDNKLKAFPV